jgi:preprotein translocase subunit SecF
MPSLASLGNDLYTGRRSFDFVGRRRRWYLIAAVLMLASVLAVWLQGLNPGIEFRGGTEFRISGTSVTSEVAGEEAVTSVVSGGQVRVSRLNADSIRVQADKITDSELPTVRKALADTYQVSEDQVSQNFVGPTWGADVTRQASIGLVVFLVLVALVIALYFRTWKMAVAALVALLHDLVLTVGVYALVGFEVTPASVIGFLTILGYSLYDTVVVFDKVRENTEHITASTKRTFGEAADLAVNQTLVRSINTSVVALLPVAAILFIGAFLLGAGTLKDIALALFVGIAAGTYSSIFIATPLLVQLREREPELVAQAERVARRRRDRDAREVGDALAQPDVDVDELVSAGAAPAADSAPDRTPATGQRRQPKRQPRQQSRGAKGGKRR